MDPEEAATLPQGSYAMISSSRTGGPVKIANHQS